MECLGGPPSGGGGGKSDRQSESQIARMCQKSFTSSCGFMGHNFTIWKEGQNLTGVIMPNLYMRNVSDTRDSVKYKSVSLVLLK